MLTQADRKGRYRAIEQVLKLRVKNLRRIMELYPTQAAFARAVGHDESFISSIVGPNPRRTIGEKLARSLEHELSLETGWLDHVQP